MEESGRSPRGSVDWNNVNQRIADDLKGRSPRGSVDWNKIPIKLDSLGIDVAPLVGAWIEMLNRLW